MRIIMKHLYAIGVSLALMCLVWTDAAIAQYATQQYYGNTVEANTVIVVKEDLSQRAAARIGEIQAAYQTSVFDKIGDSGIEAWRFSGDMDGILSELNSLAGIKAFPNYMYERETLPATPVGNAPDETEAVPNDTYFGWQWGLHNDGTFETGAVEGADVDAVLAWNIYTGGKYQSGEKEGKDVIVAIMDDGINIDHPDLAPNIWNNEAEINGTDGVDDDNNGYIDDYYGWNAAANNNEPYDDGTAHGSHVAGIVGAKGNDEFGITGVNQDIKLMTVKFFDVNGSSSSLIIMRAYDYLLRTLMTGVDIVAVNQSWGGGRYLEDPSSQHELNVFTGFANAHNDYNLVWVISAGNDNINRDQQNFFSVPNNIQAPNVLVVGATNSSDARASFSDYGIYNTDIGAPGEQIISTVPNGWEFYNGTSMAAPHVTGVIALAAALYPDESAIDRAARVQATSERILENDMYWEGGKRANAFYALAPEAMGEGLLPSVETEYIGKTFVDLSGDEAVGFVNATGGPVTVTDVVISGAGEAAFFTVPPDLPKTIQPGGAFGTAVYFVPDDPETNAYSALLTIATDAGDVTINLEGLEQEFPVISLTEEYKDFGMVKKGDLIEETITVTNTGKGTLDLTMGVSYWQYSDEFSSLMADLVTYKSSPKTIKQQKPNFRERDDEVFAIASAAFEGQPREKINLTLPDEPSDGHIETMILFADSLNDADFTNQWWLTLNYGDGDSYRLFDIDETEAVNNVFLSGDFENGYANNTVSIAASPLFDFSGLVGLELPMEPAYLKFDYAAEMDPGFDDFYINVLVDGSRWGTIANTGWETLTADGSVYTAMLDISMLAGMDDVEFWFINWTDEEYVGGFGSWFDNVQIVAQEAAVYPDVLSATVAEGASQDVKLTVKTGLLGEGEYYGWLDFSSTRAINTPFQQPVSFEFDFQNVVGHLSVVGDHSSPEFVSFDLGQIYRDGSVLGEYSLINDGIVPVNYETMFGLYKMQALGEPARAKALVSDGTKKPSGISKEQRLQTFRDFRMPLEHGKAAGDYSSAASSIFASPAGTEAETYFYENYDANQDLEGWFVFNHNYGLGSTWKVRQTPDGEYAMLFGDVENGYLNNSNTEAITPFIDLLLIDDREEVWLEFEYSALLEVGYDFLDIYVGVVEESGMVYHAIASTDPGFAAMDLMNDGGTYDLAIDVSSIAADKSIVVVFHATSDGSVYGGYAAIDDVMVHTKDKTYYITPVAGTLEPGDTQEFDMAIVDAADLTPGEYYLEAIHQYDYMMDDVANARSTMVFGDFEIINSAPMPESDEFFVVTGDAVPLSTFWNVALSNDVDYDNDMLEVVEYGAPKFGSFKQLDPGSDQWYYVAPPTPEITDVVKYHVTDGFDSTPAEMHLKVVSKAKFATAAQQNFTMFAGESMEINTMRLASGVGGNNKNLYVWAETESDLVEVIVDRQNHKLILTAIHADLGGMAHIDLHLGYGVLPLDSMPISVAVVVNPEVPVASFKADFSEGGVQFTDESMHPMAPEREIVAWAWSFGDGNSSDVQNPVHRYGTEGEYEVTLQVTDSEGNTAEATEEVVVSEITSVEDMAVPVEFELAQNYPNPFNPSTSIRFALPVEANVTLTVYNTLGQVVDVLVQSTMPAGYHTAEWNAADISSGMYIYKVTATAVDGGQDFTEVRKMLLMK